LAERISGRLVSPESDDFHSVRSVVNGMNGSRSQLVARCASAEHVSAAPRSHSIVNSNLAVRAGGHSAAGT